VPAPEKGGRVSRSKTWREEEEEKGKQLPRESLKGGQRREGTEEGRTRNEKEGKPQRSQSRIKSHGVHEGERGHQDWLSAKGRG